jgi:hypothetical protein
MGEVVNLDQITRLDLPPERVLNGALAKDLDVAIVVGITKEGEFYFSGSLADGSETLWWLEIAKKRLLEIGDGE